ncbi:MAG: hypothetical protein Q9169_001285 [Polycauliona sp. 2 TL-2023]
MEPNPEATVKRSSECETGSQVRVRVLLEDPELAGKVVKESREMKIPHTRYPRDVADITGLPESVASEWLKLYNNEPEKAINAWMDDPDLLERKFHSDSNGHQPYHRTDTLNPNVFNNDNTVAPSRPPSRVSTRHDARYGGYNGQLSIQDIEDHDMKEAIALSTSQTLPGQETGVTAADKQYFGPATREYRDTQNWQMTVSKATAKEIPLDPEPSDRRRPPATPAFLKPSFLGHRLSGFMKILHSIPAARELLLCRKCNRSDYGSNGEWWNGVPIEYPHLVYEGADLVESDKEIVFETQRLMALLDKTDRAYGSSDALAILPGLYEYQGDLAIIGFLGAWQNVADKHDQGSPSSTIFSTIGVRSNGETDPQTSETNVLELEVKEESFVSGQSLYEVIDSTLWPSRDGTETGEQVFLDKVADVLIMRIRRGDGVNDGLDVKIPPTWYSDRYRQSAQPQVQKMFAAKTAAEDEFTALDAKKAKLSQFGKADGSGDTCALLDSAKRYFEKTVQYLKESEEAVPSEPPTTGSNTRRHNKIIDELDKISQRVTKKLEELEESKNTVQARLRELSKLLTEPSDIPEESPHDKYTLRGVCADPHTVYVQERTKMETHEDMLDGDAEDWQWWKLHYESNQTTSISCTKVRQVEVLKAVRDESPSAVLVYANNKAMSVENKQLPPELESFVENDNSLFAAELASSPILPSTTTTLNDQTNHNNNNLDRSPPQQRTNETFRPPPRDRGHRAHQLSNDDNSLPSYSSQAVFSSPRRDASYDDFIPTQLRHSSLDNDNDMDLDEGVEMMERDHGGIGEGRKGYQLGSYEPEIEMDEDEDRSDEVRKRKAEW